MADRHDVCILGGGLAGLSLAHQLRREQPELDICVLEHRRFPVAEGTHKVGESTVEIAAHYFAETLGLRSHLEREHLPKFGLRLFVRGEQPIADDLARYDEIGVSRVLPIPTYQVDRGRLENHLNDKCREAGTLVLDGSTVKHVSVEPGRHRVELKDGRVVTCRYLVDASGRRALLRSQLDLTRPTRHKNHAIWFRVAGDIDVDALGQSKAWRTRCDTPRRFSTNHFTGPGYWVWLIPLASGMTSVGLVFDPALVDLQDVNNHTRFMRWLADEHPLVAEVLTGRSVLDFHVLRDYAVGATQMFDESGWALTGDSGAFSDPFYSPGSDFIGISNTMVCKLVAAGGGFGRAAEYQRWFNAFFASTLSLYKGLYGGFGDRDFLVLKTFWDYLYYWGVLSKLFFADKFTDVEFMRRATPSLEKAAALNGSVQRRLRKMAAERRRYGGHGAFYDQHDVTLFHELKQDLMLNEGDALGALQANVALLDVAAPLTSQLASASLDGGKIPSMAALDQRLRDVAGTPKRASA